MPAAAPSEEIEGLLVWFVLGRGENILEFIQRCADPTPLGGLEMVASFLLEEESS